MDTFIQLQLFLENKAIPFIDDVARLRIETFREFPYLYEGNLTYEKSYLEKFCRAKNSLIVIAFDNKKVIGALTGLPLSEEESEIQEPWIEKGFDLSTIYYFNEALIEANYRNSGLGSKLFEIAEDWANKHFEQFSLASVLRADDHPSKPKNYQGLDGFWNKLGYQKQKDLICNLEWKEIGENTETKKSMIFWKKQILTSTI